MSTNSKNKQLQQQVDTPLFQAITFTVNQQMYAFNILHIRDIVLSEKIYCIPNADDILLGVTNIRGEILPVYSLQEILKLDHERPQKLTTVKFPQEKEEYLMIVKYSTFLLAINVDLINRNISVTPKNYNEGSYMNKWSSENIFSGIIIDNTDNILLIDVPTLINKITQKKTSE